MNQPSLPTVTKLELAIAESKLADLAEELRELTEKSHKETLELQETLVDYLSKMQVIIGEMYNAK